MSWKLLQMDDAVGFQMTDRIVKWATEEKLYVILDMHAAPGGNSGTNIDDSYGYPWLFEDEAAQAQTIAIWKRIALRYRNEKWVLGYDLLNEPIPDYPEWMGLNPRLEPLYKRIGAAIRTVDKRHTLILGGAQWDANLAVFNQNNAKPWDDNILYQMHTYWVPPTDATIKKWTDQRDRLNAPVWMGETGENTDAWIQQMRETLERHSIGWCFWPYKKMSATTSPVTFDEPVGWNAVAAYGLLDPRVAKVKNWLKQRPDQNVIDRAFAELLENIRFEKEHLNAGYIKALLPEAKVN